MKVKSPLPPPLNVTTGEPSWRWRRTLTFLVIGICFLLIASLGWMPPVPDTLVNQKIVEGSFSLIGWMALVYGGATTAQDIAAIVTTRSGRPYAEHVQSTPADHAPAPDVVVVNNPTPDPTQPPKGFAEG